MDIRAYDESYIEGAQNILGHMFDFGINEVGLDAKECVEYFLASECSSQFEIGNPTYIAGMTGPELMKEVLREKHYTGKLPKDIMHGERSPEYWAGWVLAYYQWLRNKRFSYILRALDIDYLLGLYGTYHEMDMKKFVELADKCLMEHYPDINLKRYRKCIGLSQRDLANESGVPLRQIQMFEQRQRDINKTSAETILRLSKALHVKMEDLME